MGFEESLAKRVLETGRCVGCGACVTVCPFNYLEYKAERPTLARECKICGVCARVCPQYEWTSAEIEKSIFSRERKPGESYGIFRRLVAAQATNDSVLGISQDGGLVTALLLFALENGLIDSAIVLIEMM